MSLITTVVLSVCVTFFIYSGYLHVKNMLKNSIAYKDSPHLLNLHGQLNSEYEIAQKQKCYGEMGRIYENMARIEKELEFRFENTRANDSSKFLSKSPDL